MFLIAIELSDSTLETSLQQIARIMAKRSTLNHAIEKLSIVNAPKKCPLGKRLDINGRCM